jgi:1-acyl-sn-glycerol-3-phosphate acyltransferase
MSSVFNTPILTPLLRGLAHCGLWISGWKIELQTLSNPPYVFIGAPHTSNWDFVLMIATVLSLKLNAKWLGKDSLFKTPFGGLMRWLGGIPVDRSQSHNLVSQTAQCLTKEPNLILCIPPEGTRKKVKQWKTGFYYIALEAGVPIQLTAIDAATKRVRLLGTYQPTGDADREIREIQRHYQGFFGLIPENCFEIPD